MADPPPRKPPRPLPRRKLPDTIQEELDPAVTRDQDLDQEMFEAAVAWLREQWGRHRPCPYCENTTWEVGLPVEFALASGFSPPHFYVVCSKCGNTVFVDAWRAGVGPRPENL